MAQKQSWNKMGGLLGGGPNPYGDFNRKDRIDFSDALLTPEEKKRVALKGHFVGNPDVANIMKKDREKDAAKMAMIDSQMMEKGDVGEAEGRLSADAFQRTQGIYGEDELDQRGPTVDTEESALDRIGAENRGRAASMADFDDEEGGGFWNEALGLLRPDSIGKPEKKKYRDVDTEGDNRYLNKLAREEFESGRDKGQHPFADSPSYTRIKEDTEGESELDRIGRDNMLNAMDDLGPDKMEKPGESIDQSSWLSDAGDWLSEKFSSDDKEDVEGRKAFGKALLGKATGVPEPGGGGQMRMAEARTTGGKVAFPGLLNKPQRQRTPYFMPKGLV